ncbi:nucleoside monophosphate kinase [Candidatus Microgenomates bacterium]|jgi:adenylate kinase|nr:MAG: nucleoside monophosphate kinase [Candidatus Microgenomates bacterium]
MNLLIIGPQASGKGTQAENLIEKFGLAHVEMGGLLRRVSKEDSELGNKVREVINSGKLLSDELVVEILNQHLSSLGRLDNILFDGFPRVLSQAQYFEKFLEKKGKKLDAVIYLTLPREITFERLANRRTCGTCGKVFNLKTKPPKKEGVCDYCGGNLVVRSDETPEKIETRLNEFEAQTLPMVTYLKQKGLVEEIDGNRPIEIIFADISERLKKRGLVKNA